MTHCLIIGATGMLGAGLADALLVKGAIAGKAVEKLTLFDIFKAKARHTAVSRHPGDHLDLAEGLRYKRALSLGFEPDASFEAIVEAYLEDHASEAH